MYGVKKNWICVQSQWKFVDINCVTFRSYRRRAPVASWSWRHPLCGLSPCCWYCRSQTYAGKRQIQFLSKVAHWK
jgi:hypothetical protein